ncbi:thioredoxin fold domain-containing protein [uncultured Desulfobacter sp.]|uniref:thioredoxin fold domain-containing protein n=1 Tax=uncultured Desulfobacter sp. TaxID=240139 RepID=UPI002AA83C08|nr:thioredoxin fold domain-containing protein [uncultured Desulfobacter sp.]
MKSDKTKMIGIAAVFLLLLGACAARTAHENTTVEQEGQPEPNLEAAGKNELNQKIAAAIEKARKEGKTSVDVNLDEIAIEEIPGIVQPGDLIKISYNASLENGEPITKEAGETRNMTAGQGGVIAQEILGMKLNQKKKSVIAPENVFGLHKAENVQTFAAQRTMPVDIEISAQGYKKQFNSLPRENDPIQITPYFESKVIHADDQKIMIHNFAENGAVREDAIGKTTTFVKDGVITISLEAKKGAPFSVGKKTGNIIEADEKSFSVDFNHPYAGKKMILDLEVLSIKKASEFSGLELAWIEDHDQGFDVAFKEKKNKVIMLYADWCQWCEKMFSQTFKDPRIKMLADQFVWIKANSDVDQSLKEFYGQEGFPMIVLSDYHGKILKKMEGFKSADNLLPELEKILNTDVAKADTSAETKVGN